MSEEKQNTLIIHGQYIKDLSFENPGAPQSFSITEQPSIEISLDISTGQLEESVYEVTTKITITSKIKDQLMFIIDLEYAGVFTIKAVGEEELEGALLVKCPEILYPFIRRIIFNLTTDGGFAPLTLQPIDFLSMYRDKKEGVTDSIS